MGHEQELRREIMQRNRAIANGALVRPPRNIRELDTDEAANTAEIDRLEARRGDIFRRMSEPLLAEWERSDLSHSLAACSHSLEIAFADRRRLRVARELHRQGIFA
jgi:hypothetical protein